ncbi:hypothetical protein [Sphingobacterium sp. 1.A.4]|uniref:hypothetical protein n=1 Tax=Sphingobacterium sp. 1.A.4 TaxID=2044603 RepID=UPI000C0BD6EF|nr:hypothetical protein [Sphingobacterium sp. 1.A.4]
MKNIQGLRNGLSEESLNLIIGKSGIGIYLGIMKKSKGERLNWQKESEVTNPQINFKELKPNKIKILKRKGYKYLIP